MPKYKNIRGVIDPITAIGVLFLIITLTVGTAIVKNKDFSLNINEMAMRITEGTNGRSNTTQTTNNSATNNRARDEDKTEEEVIEEEKGLSCEYGICGNKCCPKPATNNNTKKTDNVQQQTSTDSNQKCNANGAIHDEGSVVVGGRASSGYSKCQNGRWEPCETCKITDLTTVPAYLEEEYLRARGLTYGQQVREITSTLQLESSECSNTGGQWTNNGCVYPTVGERRCSGNTIEFYSGGSWTTSENCDGGCIDGKCISRIRQDVSIVKTDEGFDRSVTTLTRDNQDNIIPSLTTTTPLDVQTPINIEKIDEGFIRNFNTIIRNANTNEILSYLSQRITPTQQIDTPECGKPGLSELERDQCRNIARVTAYNSPIVGRYIKAFSGGQYLQWQQLGYNSAQEAIQDCVNKNGITSGYACSRQMTSLGAEQVASSVSLGTTGTMVGALTVASGGFATGALTGAQAIALGFAGMSTYQTGTAVDVCITNPGSDHCYTQTGWALLSYANIGSSALQMANQGARWASNLNSTINAVNIAMDVVDISQSCGDGEYASGFGCGAAIVGTVFDVGQGGVDIHRALSNRPGSLVSPQEAGAALNRIFDISNTVDVTPDAIGVFRTANDPNRIVGLLPSGEITPTSRFNSILNNSEIQAPLPIQPLERFASQSEFGLIADLEARARPTEMLFAPIFDTSRNIPFDPTIRVSYQGDTRVALSISDAERIAEEMVHYHIPITKSPETGFLPNWTNVGANPIANFVFGNPKNILDDPPIPLTTRIWNRAVDGLGNLLDPLATRLGLDIQVENLRFTDQTIEGRLSDQAIANQINITNRPEYIQRAIDDTFEETRGNHVPGYIVEGEATDYKFGGILASEVVQSKITTNSSGNVSVLDIGAAKGGFINEIKHTYPQVEVSGLTANDYRNAENPLNNLDYRIGNAENIRTVYPDNSFDVIVSSVTVRHFTDPLGTLTEIYRLLKVDGIMLIDNFHIPGISNSGDQLIQFLKNNGYEVKATFELGEDTIHKRFVPDQIETFIIKKTANRPELRLPIEYNGLNEDGHAIYKLTQDLPPHKMNLPKAVQDLFLIQNKYINDPPYNIVDFDRIYSNGPYGYDEWKRIYANSRKYQVENAISQGATAEEIKELERIQNQIEKAVKVYDQHKQKEINLNNKVVERLISKPTNFANWFERNISSPTQGFLDGVRNWWDETIVNPRNWGPGSPAIEPVRTTNSNSTNPALENVLRGFDKSSNQIISAVKTQQMGGKANTISANEALEKIAKEYGYKIVYTNGETVKINSQGKTSLTVIDVKNAARISPNDKIVYVQVNPNTPNDKIAANFKEFLHEINTIAIGGKITTKGLESVPVEDLIKMSNGKLNRTSVQKLYGDIDPVPTTYVMDDLIDGRIDRRMFDNQSQPGQTLIEFSAALPIVIAAPATILYYADQYFDLGVTDYVLDSIDNALANEQEPKRITDPAYDSINFWLKSAAIAYGLNNDKDLSEIAINNPNQRPYDEIIQEGIDNYIANNPNSDIYYETNPQALSIFGIFKQIFNKESISIISSTLGDESFKKVSLSGKIMTMSENLITNRNEFIKSIIGAAGNIGLFTKDGGTYPIGGFDNEIKNLTTLIEDEVKNTGSPVSHSFVIEYFLEKNNGDLAQAILDSSNFEEELLRNTDDGLADTYGWIQHHILDEYSPLLPYETLPKQEAKLDNSEIYYDYSLPNRLGEIYHGASITALLHYLPPEMIRSMVIGEYLSYGDRHGLVKLSADLEILKELNDINDLLESYEQPTK